MSKLERATSPNPLRSQRGFGLLETVIALGVMVGSYFVLTGTFVVSQRVIHQADSTATLQAFLRAARTILATEEGCQRNFKNMAWNGTSGHSVNVTQIKDQSGNSVISIGEQIGVYKFQSGAVREISKTRTTPDYDYHQVSLDLNLASTLPTALYSSNSMRVPMQFVVNRAGSVVSCYSIGLETGMSMRVNLPTCPTGQVLNGITATGAPVCVNVNLIPVCSGCGNDGDIVTVTTPCTSECKVKLPNGTYQCVDATQCAHFTGQQIVGGGDECRSNGHSCDSTSPCCEGACNNGYCGGRPPGPNLALEGSQVTGPCGTAPMPPAHCDFKADQAYRRTDPSASNSSLFSCNRAAGSYVSTCPVEGQMTLANGQTFAYSKATIQVIGDHRGYQTQDVIVSIPRPTNDQLRALGIPIPPPGQLPPGVNVLQRDGEVVGTESYVPVSLAGNPAYKDATTQAVTGQINRDTEGRVIAGSISYDKDGASVTEIYTSRTNEEGQECQIQTNIVDGEESGTHETCK